MAYPVVILRGGAGSGKDYVADLLCRHFGATKLALADPMKTLVKHMLGVDRDVLWGPSERRGERITNEHRKHCAKYGENIEALLQLAFSEGLGLPTSINYTTVGHWVTREVLRDGELPTVRHLLQTLGTEYVRKAQPSAWIDIALETAAEMLEGRNYSEDKGLLETRSAPPPFVIITDGRFANEVLEVKRSGGVAINIESPTSNPLSGEEGKHQSENDIIPRCWFDIQHVNRRDSDSVRDIIALRAKLAQFGI